MKLLNCAEYCNSTANCQYDINMSNIFITWFSWLIFLKDLSLLPVILPIFFVPLIKLPANPETWAPKLYPIRWTLLLENWMDSWKIMSTWFRWRNVKSKQWNIYCKLRILWSITQEICMSVVVEWGAWIIQYISIGWVLFLASFSCSRKMPHIWALPLIFYAQEHHQHSRIFVVCWNSHLIQMFTAFCLQHLAFLWLWNGYLFFNR